MGNSSERIPHYPNNYRDIISGDSHNCHSKSCMYIWRIWPS